MPAQVDVLPMLLAVALLIGGTIAFTLSLALLARLVGRLWDAWDAWAASGSGSDDRGRSRRGATPSRGRLAVGVPRPVLVALLVTSLMCGLAWLSYVLGQVGRLE